MIFKKRYPMESIKTYLRGRLDFKKRRFLKRIYEQLITFPHVNDLNRLARIYKTDKWGSHFYTPHYQHHFLPFKNKKINILEIGVGGYDSPIYGGDSLRMWKRFFPKANIYSLDIYDKSLLQEKRIKIFQGSQVDEKFLEGVVNEIGELSLIIDDGSHINEHIISTFNLLFPKLKFGGIYVVEDIQTSYWPDYGGSGEEMNKEGTAMHFFKSLIDGLNHAEFIRPGYRASYYDLNITSMHFYHNLVFIYKGPNNEGSNLVINNERLL